MCSKGLSEWRKVARVCHHGLKRRSLGIRALGGVIPLKDPIKTFCLWSSFSVFTKKAELGATEGKGSYAEVAGVPRHPFWCNKIKMPASICTSHTCCPQVVPAKSQLCHL